MYYTDIEIKMVVAYLVNGLSLFLCYAFMVGTGSCKE